MTTVLASFTYIVTKRWIGTGLLVWNDGSKSMSRLMTIHMDQNREEMAAATALFTVTKTVAVAMAV